MISVSDRQLRIVAAAADLLPVEARGTFLRRVVVELRGRRDFSDCDIEQVLARRCAISQRHHLLEDKAAGRPSNVAAIRRPSVHAPRRAREGCCEKESHLPVP